MRERGTVHLVERDGGNHWAIPTLLVRQTCGPGQREVLRVDDRHVGMATPW
jgi:hypothetical protein